MANKLFAVALAFIIMISFVLPVSAVEPVGFQPTFFDYSYFPLMPDLYYSKPYKLILLEKSTGYYHLFTSDSEFYYLPIHNFIIRYDNSLYYNHFIFEPDNKNLGWIQKSNKRDFRVSPFSDIDIEKNFYFYYINHDIKNRVSLNQTFFKRNDIDFINVTLALCDLRYYIKLHLSTFVPIGVLLFSSFIGLYLIRKWFYSMSHGGKKMRKRKRYRNINHKKVVWKK